MISPRSLATCAFLLGAGVCLGATEVPPLPARARLALSEDWSAGKVDATRWYVPRCVWGAGSNGVTPANVRVERDPLLGRTVLICRAHGDRYDGPVTGDGGRKPRVGGMVVSRAFLASGRFEIEMRIGSPAVSPGGPADPTRPSGCVPAVWTYAYRLVKARGTPESFDRGNPLYNPQMRKWGDASEYWSELDFPEFGAKGDFSKGLYNTFLQNKHQSRVFETQPMADGRWHTLVTEWRTGLVPLPGIKDSQVVAAEGFHWVADTAVPFNSYLGNPLRRLGPNHYAVCAGLKAVHYLDGRKVGENPTFVPSMAAQLTLGVWFPEWAGPADWATTEVRFGRIQIWQFDDPGDVRGVLTRSLADNY